MATWEDGPAYAPRQRPFGFTQPASAYSLAPAPPPPLQPPAPASPPLTFQAPGGQSPAWAALAPPDLAARDPRRAFSVVTTTMTQDGSAWGFAHTNSPQSVAAGPAVAWTADQPWQSQYAPPTAAGGHFPAPGTPQWFATGPIGPTPPVAWPVNAKTLIESTSLPFIIVLGLGVLLQPLSFICLPLGIVCVQIMRYRRWTARWSMLGIWLVAFSLYLVNENEALAQIGCLVSLAVGLLIQFLALRAGDRPERRN